MRVVVALGGNAVSPGRGTGSAAEMRTALGEAAGPLADLVCSGVELVITHGNGPQVGRILAQQRLAASSVPPMPMDVCGAQSQGQVGYLIAQSVDSELRRRGVDRGVLCMLTQVLVDARDPAFERPTKPVGASYSAIDPELVLRTEGVILQEQPDGRWRRVVPSPEPVSIVEAASLRAIVEAGHVVVAAGGGGIPVVADGPVLRGVEAVVDKDRTAALLASLLEADTLAILTDVEAVQVGFGTPRARPLQRLTATEAEDLLARGELPEGSMGPKVAACVRFVRAGGGRAVIGGLHRAHEVVHGRSGTEIVP